MNWHVQTCASYRHVAFRRKEEEFTVELGYSDSDDRDDDENELNDEL